MAAKLIEFLILGSPQPAYSSYYTALKHLVMAGRVPLYGYSVAPLRGATATPSIGAAGVINKLSVSVFKPRYIFYLCLRMKFAEIVGHEEIKKKLISSVQHGRVPHAQLFLGQEGSGNLALALAYAQYLNCTQPTDTDACGTCSSCIKYGQVQHPDLHFCFPVFGSWDSGSNPSDHYMAQFHDFIKTNPYGLYIEWMEKISDSKAGIINVAQSSEVIRKLTLKPYEARHQVMIIWMPETMNTAAANKLLKTIEEPPDKSVLLLVANNDEEMLNTILSRLQYVKLKKIPDMEMLAALTSRFEVSFDKATEIVNVADGNYHYAMHLAQAEDVEEDVTGLLKDWFRTSYGMEIGKLNEVVDKISKLSREKQKEFYEYAIHMFRQAMAMNNAQQVARVTSNEREFLSRFSLQTPNHKIPLIIEKIEKGLYYVDRNANAKILAMNLSLDLYEVLKLEK